MKRIALLAIACGSFVVLCPMAIRGAAQEPGSPEAVVSKAVEAVNHGRVDDFVSAMHPDSLKEFRTVLLSTIDNAVKQVGEERVLKTFPPAKTVDELKELPAEQLFASVVKRMTADPNMMKAMAKMKVDVFGNIPEGKDRAHVIYRTKVKMGETDIVRLNVATLRKSGSEWKMAIPDDFAGPMNRAGGPAGLAIKPEETEYEPIGHLLDGKDALILYRATMPVGDSSVSKLAVMPLSARDPAMDAVRNDRMPEVKALLKSRLGSGTSTTNTAPAAATKNLAPTKSTAGRTGVGAKAMPSRTAKTTPKSKSRKAKTARPTETETETAASELPEGLAALPESFRGGDRDRFQDIAPKDGKLVGAKVSYIMRFGGPKISSIQPIYRVGQKLVTGQRRGGLLGKETTAVAKAGYAVGAINTHTGLTVDGFEFVFMKIDGDQLDTNDSYKSPWLGDEKGGSPNDVSSDGKIPVGLQGRAGKEVYALGLIVEK